MYDEGAVVFIDTSRELMELRSSLSPIIKDLDNSFIKEQIYRFLEIAHNSEKSFLGKCHFGIKDIINNLIPTRYKYAGVLHTERTRIALVCLFVKITQECSSIKLDLGNTSLVLVPEIVPTDKVVLRILRH